MGTIIVIEEHIKQGFKMVKGYKQNGICVCMYIWFAMESFYLGLTMSFQL